MFEDNGMLAIWKKIMSAGTDGASVMRSTRDFAGLDCKGTDGRAFSAFLKRDLKDDLDFWHCLYYKQKIVMLFFFNFLIKHIDRRTQSLTVI